MDERRVTNFPIVDFLTVDNRVAHERYPLAGEANPRVTLRVVNASTATSRLVYDAAARDEYLANFDWVPHRELLEAELLDRAATHDARRSVARSARRSNSALPPNLLDLG